jgi:hypothetical protein
MKRIIEGLLGAALSAALATGAYGAGAQNFQSITILKTIEKHFGSLDLTSPPFGAKCDGVTDDTAAINKVDAAAALANLTVTVTGTCIATTITLTHSVAFTGAGTIKQKAATSGDLISISGTGVNVSMRGLTIDGNQQNQSDNTAAASIKDTALGGPGAPARLTLDGMKFVNGRLADVYYNSDNDPSTDEYLLVRNSSLTGGAASTEANGKRYVYANGSLSYTIEGSTFDYSASAAPGAGRAGVVGGNAATDASGILGTPVTASIINNEFRGTGNDITNTLGSVELYSTAARYVVTGNRLYNVYGRGISIKSDSCNYIINGNVVDGLLGTHADAGIALQQKAAIIPCQNGMVSNNTVTNSALDGINFIGLGNGAPVTITIASPGVLTATAHGLTVGDPVVLATTGALPTGLTAGTTYYVQSVPTANSFTLAATNGGAVINTSGTQSGTHSWARLGATTNFSGVVAAGNQVSDVARYGSKISNIGGLQFTAWRIKNPGVSGIFAQSLSDVAQISDMTITVSGATNPVAKCIETAGSGNPSTTATLNLYGNTCQVIGSTPVTISIASPGVLTKTAHGLNAGDTIILSTANALPTGLAAGTVYFVKTVPTADTFTLSATSGGAAINTSGTQSGTQSYVLQGMTGFYVQYVRAATLAHNKLISIAGDGITVTQTTGPVLVDANSIELAGTGWPVKNLGTNTKLWVTETNVVSPDFTQTQRLLSVSGGAITVWLPLHVIDLSGGAQTITQINGGVDGVKITLRASTTANTLTIATAGNLVTNGSKTFAFSTSNIMFQLMVGIWREVGRVT